MRRVGRFAGYVTPKPPSVPSGSSTWMCVTGEPCETERLMHGSEGGRRKSAPLTRSNSPAAYPTCYGYFALEEWTETLIPRARTWRTWWKQSLLLITPEDDTC